MILLDACNNRVTRKLKWKYSEHFINSANGKVYFNGFSGLTTYKRTSENYRFTPQICLKYIFSSLPHLEHCCISSCEKSGEKKSKWLKQIGKKAPAAVTNLKAFSTLFEMCKRNGEMLLFADIHQSYLQRSMDLVIIAVWMRVLWKFHVQLYILCEKQIAFAGHARKMCSFQHRQQIYWRSQTICIFAVMFSFNRKSIHIPPLLRYTKIYGLLLSELRARCCCCCFFFSLECIRMAVLCIPTDKENEKKHPLKMSIF